MARTGFARRAALGLMAAAFAVGPLAVAATAQDSDPQFNVDPPDEYSDFEPSEPLLSDAEAAEIVAQVNTDELLLIMSLGLPDTDGDGIPDIPEGEPGERDLPPGTRLLEFDEDTGDIILMGETAIPVDASVDTVGGGGSFLQGQCAGTAVSYSGDGEVLDAAIGLGSTADGVLLDIQGDGAGERAFTESNPFQVRPDGKVLYSGFLPYDLSEGALEHNWEITTANISLDKGGDPNPKGKNVNAGVVDLEENIPTAARFTGIFPVQGWLFSENGRYCIAEGWVEFTGPFPLATAPGAVAAFFALGGVMGLLFNARPAITWRA